MNQADIEPAAERPGRYDWRGSSWIAALSVALLATSEWLSATTIEYLVIGATATLVGAALASRLPALQRRWPLVATALVGIAIGIGAGAQFQVASLERNWPEVSNRTEARALNHLERAVASAATALQSDVRKALGAPPDRGEAFSYLARIPGGSGRDVVLRRGDSAFAWAGRPRVALRPVTDGITVTGEPFYLTMLATQRADGQLAVASQLLYATPP
ncbi:MAG TPA: hypothetical protein VF483_05240, partial [Gemmatimonadaceae bacterium]